MGRGNIPTRHLMSSTVPRIGNKLVKMSHRHTHTHTHLQISHAIAKATSYSPLSSGKALLPKTALAYVIEHGDTELVPTSPLLT